MLAGLCGHIELCMEKFGIKFLKFFPKRVLTLIATGVTMHWKTGNNAVGVESSDYDRICPEWREWTGR
jgi:hypothetical protein